MLLAATQKKGLQAMASLPLSSFVALGRNVAAAEKPCKVQDAFTSCQRLQLLCHTTEPTMLGRTVQDRCHPCCSCMRAQGAGWGTMQPAVILPPFQQSLGQMIGA